MEYVTCIDAKCYDKANFRSSVQTLEISTSADNEDTAISLAIDKAKSLLESNELFFKIEGIVSIYQANEKLTTYEVHYIPVFDRGWCDESQDQDFFYAIKARNKTEATAIANATVSRHMVTGDQSIFVSRIIAQS